MRTTKPERTRIHKKYLGDIKRDPKRTFVSLARLRRARWEGSVAHSLAKRGEFDLNPKDTHFITHHSGRDTCRCGSKECIAAVSIYTQAANHVIPKRNKVKKARRNLNDTAGGRFLSANEKKALRK